MGILLQVRHGTGSDREKKKRCRDAKLAIGEGQLEVGLAVIDSLLATTAHPFECFPRICSPKPCHLVCLISKKTGQLSNEKTCLLNCKKLFSLQKNHMQLHKKHVIVMMKHKHE